MVRVTHRFHPLFGKEFVFVDRRLAWDVDRVSFLGEDAVVASLPAAWTDIDPVDPFVTLAEGRCAFRPCDLLALADLIDGLGRGGVGGSAP